MPVTVAPVMPEPQVPDPLVAYVPSNTVEDFILSVANGPRSEFRVLALDSSRGEGKTSAAIYAIIALGQRMIAEGFARLLPIRVAVVRDTWINLSRSTLATFEKNARKGLDIQLVDGGREARLRSGPDQLAHFFFFGIDNRDDVDKLQGFECGVLWLEEVAPGAELDQGIPAETFGAGATSVRQEGVPKRILLTYNPPDEDHWPIWHGTPVLTPTGWVKIGDLNVGDEIMAVDGSATRVTGVYRRGVQPLYRVIFSDGAAILATDDHPFGIQSKRDRSGKGKRTAVQIVTTGQIRERLARAPKRHVRTEARRQARWSIPLVDAVRFPSQPVPIDPYALGALLGDGCLTQGEVKLCSTDQDILDHVRAGLPKGVRLRQINPAHPKLKYRNDYVVISDGGSRTPNPINRAIKILGLAGHTALTKFVPEMYLWNSIEVRLAVLQGLLDTDGHASPDGNSVSFASISERLIEGVEFLVRSLGGITRRRAKGPVGPRRPHELFVIGVVLPDGVAPFRLSRKNARLNMKTKRHTARRYIVGCEPCGEGEAVCISVAHPSRLFVAEHFVVTHNSMNVEEILQEKGLDNVIYHRFHIPPGERSEHFRNMAALAMRHGDRASAEAWEYAADEFDEYRKRNEVFLESIGRTDLVDRLVLGKVGGVAMGEAVISNFDYELHVTKPGEILVPQPGEELWRCHDGGLTPSTVWCGITAAGNVNVYGSRTSINKAMAQHIIEEVIPFQEKDYIGEKWKHGQTKVVRPFSLAPPKFLPGTETPTGTTDAGGRVGRDEPKVVSATGFGKAARGGWDYLDVGDPALFQRDQVKNAETSAGQEIDRLLRTNLQKGPVEWGSRREAGNLAFYRQGGTRGRPRCIRIQREENGLLIKALNGRAHYVVDMATGRINPSVEALKRVSGVYFQALDAFMYFLAVKFPAHEWPPRPPQRGRRKPQGPPNWAAV